MIRLKDVAAKAGVSLMTVSKVIRDAPDVSQATKARVRRLAEEMGYFPDALAQGLRTRRTRLFGLVIPSLTHPWLGPVVAAIQDRAQQLGYELLITQTHDNPQREEVCIRRLLARRVDGLFVRPAYRLAPSAPIYDELHKSGKPTILLGHRAPFCQPFLSVETDDMAASYQVTQHLIGLGHRQIAFLAGPPAAPAAQERFEGYRRALRDAELTVEDRLIFSAGETVVEGQRAAQQLLSEATPATAVQTVSDLAAIGVATVLWQHGLRIPEDCSLAGFGDHLAAEYLRVPLTTVRQPTLQMGVTAVESLLRLLAGGSPESHRLPAELVIRASTAAPAAARPSAARQTISLGMPLGAELQ